MVTESIARKITFNDEDIDEKENIIDRASPSDINFKWESLGLKPALVKGVYSIGFENPSSIQRDAIPIIAEGKDLRAQAQSGTGKTGAFVIGTLQVIDENLRETQVIALASTREIAAQNAAKFAEIGAYMKITTCLLAGGYVSNDIKALATLPQIVVGTPGRVGAMIQEGHLNTSKIKIFILDEADEMLKEDFEESVKKIYVSIKAQKFQSLLFSATYSEKDLEVIKNMVENPTEIDLRYEDQTLKGIKQFFVDIGPSFAAPSSAKEQEIILKAHTVMDIFKNQQISQAIIFYNRKSGASLLYRTLNENGMPCELITADLTQEERVQTLDTFKAGKTRILVSSGLCKRGVDVQALSVVVCLDVPSLEDKNDFIHRVGRSGRYGRKGVALHILNSQEVETLKTISEHFHSIISPLPAGFSFKD
ncbi:translation initiation factor eIF4A [Glugoides intestinalis]